MLKFLIIGLLLFVIEFYTYQAFKQYFKKFSSRLLYVMASVILVLFIGYGFSKFDPKSGDMNLPLTAGALIVLFYLPKLILTLVLLVEDVARLSIGVYRFIQRELGDKQSSRVNEDEKDSIIPGRRKFVTNIALGIVSIPFLSVLHGITIGRYRFQVHEHIIEFSDLPSAFDGFRFTQLSDIHFGSFDDPEKLMHAVELINAQRSDMLLFTGDMVNSVASEVNPWLSTFRKIRPHKYGQFSILGNHDYGTYAHWETDEMEDKNFNEICDISDKLNFQLLRNEHVSINKDGESICVVGVENWGANGKFMKFGDLDKATQGIESTDFKILMSHDPSHWDAQILDHPMNFQLTLSGHTHGSQFGIEIPGFLKWSPIQYVYKQWAGLYETLGKYLYVNRGFGYHAYKGRTGIWPEITVIELRVKK
ncbi:MULTISPECIES: metallophosphoesterase [Myroides]|uniref:Metallophosphoesterase n=1 Tax=Myroides albus TaxID=2562892 RepID=A0A6I3LJN8_9FLAO|nr:MULTISPECIES: metallophosphoesterase [Myroides]MTG98483.1 metallophosphoesterase [Myroides albus]MVX34454.1 metallophosphoesterase [Myroides sp. LoEW2-1]UVD78240.1 metallophosphoesterase [Myroides albus]